MTTEAQYQAIIGRLEKAALRFLREWQNDPENPDTYDAADDLAHVLGVSASKATTEDGS